MGDNRRVDADVCLRMSSIVSLPLPAGESNNACICKNNSSAATGLCKNNKPVFFTCFKRSDDVSPLMIITGTLLSNDSRMAATASIPRIENALEVERGYVSLAAHTLC